MRRLVVLARAPQKGAVKSRLAAGLGEARALAIYRELFRRTLSVVAQVANAQRELCLTGVDELGDARAAVVRHGLRLTLQQGTHLGERMACAMAGVGGDPNRATVDPDGGPVVLVGTDCPALTPACVTDAFEALEHSDAVFVPTDDGGYALVGVARPLRAIFEGPTWGTSTVMDDTRRILRDVGACWTELPTLWDVDTVDDLRRWQGAALDRVGSE
jgi:rSAM/selenodomain-associated transferase 1